MGQQQTGGSVGATTISSTGGSDDSSMMNTAIANTGAGGTVKFVGVFKTTDRIQTYGLDNQILDFSCATIIATLNQVAPAAISIGRSGGLQFTVSAGRCTLTETGNIFNGQIGTVGAFGAGVIPTGLTAGTRYQVINRHNDDTFDLSTDLTSGASNIVTLTGGSGTFAFVENIITTNIGVDSSAFTITGTDPIYPDGTKMFVSTKGGTKPVAIAPADISEQYWNYSKRISAGKYYLYRDQALTDLVVMNVNSSGTTVATLLTATTGVRVIKPVIGTSTNPLASAVGIYVARDTIDIVIDAPDITGGGTSSNQGSIVIRGNGCKVTDFTVRDAPFAAILVSLGWGTTLKGGNIRGGALGISIICPAYGGRITVTGCTGSDIGGEPVSITTPCHGISSVGNVWKNCGGGVWNAGDAQYEGVGYSGFVISAAASNIRIFDSIIRPASGDLGDCGVSGSPTDLIYTNSVGNLNSGGLTTSGATINGAVQLAASAPLTFKSGASNLRYGTGTMSGVFGTTTGITVGNTLVTSTCIIICFRTGSGTGIQSEVPANRVVGTSFNVISTAIADSNTFGYLILETN